jgi:hypothetical protein
MPNAIYPKFKGALAIAAPGTSWINGNIVAVLVSAAYVYSDANQYLSDIPAGARVAVSGSLTGASISPAGAFDTDDVTLLAVTGDTVTGAALYLDTGSEDSSRLVYFQDNNTTGIPFTPNGSGVTLTVDAAGWFTL